MYLTITQLNSKDEIQVILIRNTFKRGVLMLDEITWRGETLHFAVYLEYKNPLPQLFFRLSFCATLVFPQMQHGKNKNKKLHILKLWQISKCFKRSLHQVLTSFFLKSEVIKTILTKGQFSMDMISSLEHNANSKGSACKLGLSLIYNDSRFSRLPISSGMNARWFSPTDK